MTARALAGWRRRCFGADVPYITYVGKPTERRNLSALIRAFAVLKRAHGLPHKLLIVGADLPGTSPFRSVIAELGLEHDVVIRGHVTHAEMVSVYNAAALFIYPSSYEGFGMPVLEAMACGAPVITLDNTAFPEFAGGVAHLLPDARVETLVTGMLHVLGDEAVAPPDGGGRPPSRRGVRLAIRHPALPGSDDSHRARPGTDEADRDHRTRRGDPQHSSSRVRVTRRAGHGRRRIGPRRRRRGAWAGGHGVPAVFADPGEMIERTRPDIVAVCSPPDLHRAHAELALSRRMSRASAKSRSPPRWRMPMRSSLAAERSGLQVVVNNQFPAMRIHRAARDAIGTPEFGRLLYLHAWHTMRPTAHTEAGWRGTMPRRLGMEFGIHVLDLVRFFFGATPTRILAHMPRPDAGRLRGTRSTWSPWISRMGAPRPRCSIG